MQRLLSRQVNVAAMPANDIKLKVRRATGLHRMHPSKTHETMCAQE